MFKCERCGKETYIMRPCMGCKRKVCPDCEKSGKRIKTHDRLLICKDCWSKMPRRKTFKSA